LIRLAVRCAPGAAERVLAELVALAPGGVEEEHGESYVEYAIYGPPGELPALPDLEAAAGDGLVEVSSSEVPDDWADRWRDFHGPIVVGERLRVRPSWVEDAGGRESEIDVVIDPAQAFGTGAHATTRLCLELLLELATGGSAPLAAIHGGSPRGSALGALADWGTGSGVLAIAAAKLGFSPVAGCDHEPAALEAAEGNAAANAVHLELARVNLREEPPPTRPTVTANLTAPVLRAAAERLDAADAPRTLICSGLLAGELDDVAAGFARSGLVERDSRAEGEWRALLLAR
jgi:ribosomal protein L11 methyltransferase